MNVFRTKLSAIFLPLVLVAAPALAAIPAHPGMLNYVEGQARVNERAVTSASVGTIDIADGQVIETGNGKAEILLTPGVFLRLGDNSAARMESAGLTDTRVAILSGRAMIEADNIQKENNIRIAIGDAVSRLEKNGLYRFTANPSEVAVFDGKVQVTENDQSVDAGKGRKVNLQTPLHATKFDRHAEENDPLYSWSKVRSQYLADASAQQARTLVVNNSGWFGGGWYWNPGFGMYSWIPANGVFWAPFGWGFYSPVTVWQAPVIYRGYYPGYRRAVVPGYRGAVVPGGRVRVPAGPAFRAHQFHGTPRIGGRR